MRTNGSFWLESMEERRLMSVTASPLPIPGVESPLPAPVVKYDWGDAPNTYHTTGAVNGPRHSIRAGFYLGASVDSEANGQPSMAAMLDDVTGVPDDEDGVTFPGGFAGFVPGSTAAINVQASAAGKLDAWIDWGRDGVFTNPADRVAIALPLSAGANAVSIAVPAWAGAGNIFARFRLSDAGVSTPVGNGGDGEVEDYGQTAASPGSWKVVDGNPNPALAAFVDGQAKSSLERSSSMSDLILTGYSAGRSVFSDASELI